MSSVWDRPVVSMSWRRPPSEPEGAPSQNMALRVTVTSHSDPEGEAIVSAAPLVGVSGLTDCRVSRVYHLDAVDELARNDVDRLWS